MMLFDTPDLVGSMARYWWAFALRGLAAVVFGVLALIWPGVTATVLVIMFGAYALWDGVFDLIAAFRTEGNRRWALVLEGIVGILAGLAAFFWPGVATFALLFIIAGWAVVTGILEIITAIRLREEIEGEWLLMLAGALSVVFGIALALWPAAGVVALTWMIGGYAILFGILLIILAFRMRSWKQNREATTA